MKKTKTSRKPKKTTYAPLLRRGCVHIQSSYNNTIITLTNHAGLTLAWSSAGRCGFKGTRKSTPFAAQCAGEQMAQQCRTHNIAQVDVFLRGPGPGREPSLRGLALGGLRLRMVRDLTCVPHNGCRSRKTPCL
ncbi:MAG: 30S ribosomal protein S11 [Opitutia bacterium TMED67]|jgi:small subunit ribosomal protein S11|nr:MAG: 30S ribosomal protein S11 [Opitutae bacterium TMED67]